MTARTLPYRHLSVRVPWHDTGWEGSICADPLANGACLRLGRIAEGRNDSREVSLAGKAWQTSRKRICRRAAPSAPASCHLMRGGDEATSLRCMERGLPQVPADVLSSCLPTPPTASRSGGCSARMRLRFRMSISCPTSRTRSSGRPRGVAEQSQLGTACEEPATAPRHLLLRSGTRTQPLSSSMPRSRRSLTTPVGS